LERRDGYLGRERRHLILKLRELVRERQRQEVAPNGYGLTELHVDRPELLEREPQPLAERTGLHRRPGQEPLDPRDRAEKMRSPDDLVEAVTQQRPLDAEQSKREPQPAERHQPASASLPA